MSSDDESPKLIIDEDYCDNNGNEESVTFEADGKVTETTNQTENTNQLENNKVIREPLFSHNRRSFANTKKGRIKVRKKRSPVPSFEPPPKFQRICSAGDDSWNISDIILPLVSCFRFND